MKLGDTPSLFLAFQPTLPLRGATFLTAIRNAPSRSFNPRSPCGERQLKTSCASSTTSFNPRSPCGERRCTRCPVGCRRPCFNPRSPCGERPRVRARTRVSHGFNPRSPCGERPRRRPCGCGTGCFNPRSPCGERPGCASSRSSSGTVSTHAPLAGSDTAFSPSGLIEQLVSTHAPLAGSDGTVSHPRW